MLLVWEMPICTFLQNMSTSISSCFLTLCWKACNILPLFQFRSRVWKELVWFGHCHLSGLWSLSPLAIWCYFCDAFRSWRVVPNQSEVRPVGFWGRIQLWKVIWKVAKKENHMLYIDASRFGPVGWKWLIVISIYKYIVVGLAFSKSPKLLRPPLLQKFQLFSEELANISWIWCKSWREKCLKHRF